MQKLIQGIHHFRANLFRPQRELFERLADGQHPDALFIIRNACNIVPPHGAARGRPSSSPSPASASRTSSSAATGIAVP